MPFPLFFTPCAIFINRSRRNKYLPTASVYMATFVLVRMNNSESEKSAPINKIHFVYGRA